MKEQVGEENVPGELFHLDTISAWRDFQPAAMDIKKLIKQAEASHLCKVTSFCDLQQHGQLQDKLLREMGWTLDTEDVVRNLGDEEVTFACDECHQSFNSAASLAVHQQRKHRRRVALRRVIVDGACRSCGRFYHTRPRLLKHLQMANTNCWTYHLRRYCPMTVEQTDVHDEHDRHQGVATHQKDLVDHTLDKAWRWCSEAEMKDILLVKEDFINDGSDPTEEELSLWAQLGMLPPGKGGRQIITRKRDEMTIHHVGQDATAYEKRGLDLLKYWQPNHDWIPGMLAEGQRYFLILYPGHRRWKDLATYIWWESNLVPICIDVAIDDTWGDMMQDKLWIDLVRARKVAGGHAGPPCETYSFARWLPNQDSLYPRPLRSAQQPWGLDFRTLRETKQWLVGNQLMWKALHLLLFIYAQGGSFTLEHPRGEGLQHGKRSIWDSAFVLQLLLFGEVRCWTFLQGPLGQPFAKPTCLLAARLPGLGQAIYEQYDLQWQPTMRLGGKAGCLENISGKSIPAKTQSDPGAATHSPCKHPGTRSFYSRSARIAHSSGSIGSLL